MRSLGIGIKRELRAVFFMNKSKRDLNPLFNIGIASQVSLGDPTFKRELRLLFILGAATGAIVFLLFYGTSILDFTNIAWLYKNPSSDLFQSQLGFDFFRKTSWSLPLGNYNSLLYPFGTSIVYTDSIPLFAIIFKFFNAVLPAQFQFIGLWGLLCYCLQGGLSAAVLRRYIKKWSVILISVPILLFASVFSFRLYMHTSLAGQWIILLAFFIFAYKDSFRSLRPRAVFWNILCVLCITVHTYFLAMIGILLIGFVINDFIEFKNIKRVLVILGSSALVTIVVFWLIGGFVSDTSQSSGLGQYSMNLNALFNRGLLENTYLGFLSPLPLAFDGQYEGMQYLGIGMIVLLFFLIFFKIKELILHLWKKEHFTWKNEYIPVIFICVVLTILAISPVVTLNKTILFSYDTYSFLNDFLSTFRATGRLFWPVFYLISFYVIIYVANKFDSKKWFIFFLCGCTALQILDMSGYLAAKAESLHPVNTTIRMGDSSFWEDASSKYKHIECLSDPDVTTTQVISYYALNSNMTVNTAYVARGKDGDQIINRMYRERYDFLDSKLSDDSIYILGKDQNLSQFSYTNQKMVELLIDGLYIIVPRNSMDLSKYQNNILPEDDAEFQKQRQFILQNKGQQQIDFSKMAYLISGFKDTAYKAGSLHYNDIDLKNTSDQVILSAMYYNSPVSLSYHWYDENMNEVQFNNPLAYFMTNVFGGETAKVHMSIQAPNVAPGKYYIAFDLVQGLPNVGWASSFSKPQNVFAVQIN
jgi:Coproporphyrinogen III oxidase and related Fe-S oxidoreductases